MKSPKPVYAWAIYCKDDFTIWGRLADELPVYSKKPEGIWMRINNPELYAQRVKITPVRKRRK